MPGDPESYVHRIGRTARAGTSGAAISFCDAEEVSDLRAIERATRQQIPVDTSHGFHAVHVATRNERQGGRPQGQRPQGQRAHGKPHGNKPQGQRGPRRDGGHSKRDDRDSRGEKPWDNRSAA
jgi:ATP-dependent RNA helicase RhlE